VALKAVDDTDQQAADSSRVPCNDAHDAVRDSERLELAEKIRQYESGAKGKLNAIFAGSLRHWLDHCSNLGKQLNIIMLSYCCVKKIIIITITSEPHAGA